MKSQKILSRKQQCASGFTLIELLVALGILVLLFTLGLSIGFNAYRGALFNSELSIIVSTLQKARNQAMNNFDQMPHGVKIENNKLILFRSYSYNPNDSINEVTERNPSIKARGLAEIIFNQLSGIPNISGEIILNDGSRTASIVINNEGAIIW